MPDSSAPSSVITVRVVYLARLRDAFASDGESLAVRGDAPTVGAAIAALRARGGAWADELAPGRAVRYAVNHEVAPAEASLRNGDELALLPPVTGG
ncbi:MAG: MoaD/ThiS family protein [Betaproteobacteria bacterium]|jgi:molybdopterin synthase sulfur carrier subunit|nr:MoaD/ThiS family protein [Betaproteobacteria bacterium]MCC7215198.1 MoaD/ThiS family protein [Burkholderiales bacterium]